MRSWRVACSSFGAVVHVCYQTQLITEGLPFLPVSCCLIRSGCEGERYEEAGITEEFAMEKTSGVLYDFIFKGFGFLAVFTGLALAALMLFAFLSGGGH